MPTAGVCGQCLKTPPHFDATLAALRYAFPADQLIMRLKYTAHLPLAILLGNLLGKRLPLQERLPDLLIPMPLHRARLAERGFNQALEIARPLARISGVPIQTTGILRARNTASQADLSAKQRLANVRRVFDSRVGFQGMSVAIVDDVMTTGASLNELAHTLKRAGAVRVENWVVARTWPGSRSKVHEHV
jgi:ComF family protein